MDDFSDLTGWSPTETASFAGALQYLEYDFMTRLAMRLMMKRDHHPTDTSQDYEYTDWGQVDHFARSCGAIVSSAEQAPSSLRRPLRSRRPGARETTYPAEWPLLMPETAL